MDKGDRTTTQTQATQFPSWLEDSQHNLHDRTRDYFNTTMANGGSPVAGLTGTQTQAGGLLGKLVNGPQRDSAGIIMGAGGGYNPAMVGKEQITSLMDPFLDTVGKSTMDAIRGTYDDASAEAGARAASASAFGGSNLALERAQLARSEAEQSESAIANLLSSGYNQAAGLATQNANAQNTAGQFGASQRLAAAQSAADASSGQFTDRLNGIGSLLNYGGLQQSQNQAEMDRIKSLLSWAQGTMPSVNGSTVSTAPDTSPTLLQQLLGGALTVGGMAVGGPAGAAGGSLLGNFLSGR